MKILILNFNANMGREGNFKPTIGNENVHQDSNDNGVGTVNFAKSRMSPHRNIHKILNLS